MPPPLLVAAMHPIPQFWTLRVRAVQVLRQRCWILGLYRRVANPETIRVARGIES